MRTLSLTRPDDWHLHLRDNDFLARTVNDSARIFARAIIMPNLSKPITDIAMAKAYYARILAAIAGNNTFTPLMTLYLTDKTTPSIIEMAKQSNIVYACKLYPSGATTHSQSGVTSIDKLYPVFEKMSQLQLPLLIHGEVTDHNVDIFDREQVFIEQHLQPITSKFPELKIVLEHVSSKQGVDFVLASNENVAATITAHHMLLTRNDLLVGGIKPHYYCLPIVKQETDRLALIAAATSGHTKFFLGTDSAPHTRNNKESACGCAGIYTAHAALELYAEIFEHANALDKLEAFASLNGPKFYGLPINTEKIMLEKSTWKVPSYLSFGTEQLIPFRAGESISWQVCQ